MKHGIPSQRQLRMGEQVKHVLSDTLRRGKFHAPILMDASDLSINEVRMTPDMKQGKAYVSSVLRNDIRDYLEALNEAAPLFQKELNKKLDTKFTPRITFIEDNTQEDVARLEHIFYNLPKPVDE